jgi:hypothetical protein
MEDLYEFLQINDIIISNLKSETRHDSEFCLYCLAYLFTDMPNDDNQIFCHKCLTWYCLDCAQELGIKYDSEYNSNECSVCIKKN